MSKSPILNNAYEEPKYYYDTDLDGNLQYDKIIEGRRPYIKKIEITPAKEKTLLSGSDVNVPKDSDEAFINGLRDVIKAWRCSGYPNTTRVTKELLDFWFNNPERYNFRKLFFCQREAVETAVYLNEVADKDPNLGRNFLFQLSARQKQDLPASECVLPRTAFKMATGTGKTVVMAMLILYNFFNRQEYHNDTRYADCFLIVTPGITIRERLGVLKIDTVNHLNEKTDYYHKRGLIPASYESRAQNLNTYITITNYHQFEPKVYSGNKKSPLDGKLVWQDGKLVKKNDRESFASALSRILGKSSKSKRLLVINDEAHHCYLPLSTKEKGDEGDDIAAENSNARVWYEGLKQLIENGYKVRHIYDLSATPYYLKGSGHQAYSLFPWVVTDFGLVEAIESGLVKIPFIPISDTSQNLSEPMYKNLYEHIKAELPQKGQKTQKKEAKEKALAEGKKLEKLPEQPPKIPGLLSVALEQFVEDYAKYNQGLREADEAKADLFSTPPVFIVVCNNTTVSKEVYKYIAGYKTVDANGGDIYVDGHFDLFSNSKDGLPKEKPPTLLIDSQVINEAEGVIDKDFKSVFAKELELFKKEYAGMYGAASADMLSDEDILREVVNSVGKPKSLGSHIKCVVSVSMLTEGWDANTVTHICGVRAFGSQLLCEQVAGRALRRMNYDLYPYNKEGCLIDTKDVSRYKAENITWKFPPEYAHIIGVPFQTFKGGGTKPVKPPKPKTLIQALPERAEYEITFPNVVGYRSENERDEIKADFSNLPKFKLDFTKIPLQTLLANAVENKEIKLETPDYKSWRDNYVIYTLTKALIARKYYDRENGRQFYYFATLKEIVKEWYENQIELIGSTDDEQKRLVILWDMDKVVANIYEGIKQSNRKEEKVTAILNYYNPAGSTKYVHGLTSKNVYPAIKSHVNFVVADTESWEQLTAKALDELAESGEVVCYVKNSFLDFKIPYIADGEEHSYMTDFIARVNTAGGKTAKLIIEISGFSNDMNAYKAEKKYYTENLWITAVNSMAEYKDEPFAFIEITDILNVKKALIDKIKTL